MKNISAFLFVVLFSTSVFAQSPEKMSYQAVIRDASNNLITNTIVGIQISILKGSVTGSSVYVETHIPSTNANGLISMEIGNGSLVSGEFTTIDWADGPYFIKTETDPEGGTNYTITGITQLLSVPYALHAKNAENFTGTINETDPVYGASLAADITETDTSNWNSKLDGFSVDGVYSDGGDIDFIAGSNVTITPDDVNNTITITSTGGGSADNLGNHTATENIRLDDNWLSGDGGDEGVYINNSGNVGIGKSNPSTRLHIESSPVTSRGQLSLSAPSGEDIFLSYYDADIFKAYLWYDVSDEDLRLQNYTASDLNLNPYGGNVGIGTNHPTATLEVAGQIKITGGTPAIGEVLTSDGTGLATWEPAVSTIEDPICFEVKRDASYIRAPVGTEMINFSSNSTVWNNLGGAFDESTSIFTAPENGIYTFHGGVYFNGLTPGSFIYAYIKAGNRHYWGPFKDASGIDEGVSVSITLYLSSGEEVSLWVNAENPDPPVVIYGNTAPFAFTYFAGAKVK